MADWKDKWNKLQTRVANLENFMYLEKEKAKKARARLKQPLSLFQECRQQAFKQIQTEWVFAEDKEDSAMFRKWFALAKSIQAEKLKERKEKELKEKKKMAQKEKDTSKKNKIYKKRGPKPKTKKEK